MPLAAEVTAGNHTFSKHSAAVPGTLDADWPLMLCINNPTSFQAWECVWHAYNTN